MNNYLILQVLGNSDVLVEGNQGSSVLQGETLEDVKFFAETNDEECLADLSKVNFPLIRKLREEIQLEGNIYYGLILTDQRQWIDKKEITGNALNEIIASDGCWWGNILNAWMQSQNINYYPIPLVVTETIPKGVADWEEMAQLINEQLSQIIEFNSNQQIIFKYSDEERIKIAKIIIQYSSGTPALSSALYLWGIEQKLARYNIDFVYISRQNLVDTHEGKHWQWRLKVPQAKQLLALQDFNGAKELLKEHPRSDIIQKLARLDKAVSLNLGNLANNSNSEQVKENVIKRIAIALWSERAFREKGQWMHWYLRVAGAFELTIYCLVESQGNDQYQWQTKEGKTSLYYPDSHGNLTYYRLTISNTVKQLLTEGLAQYYDRNTTIKYQVTPVNTDSQWSNFREFYLNNWLEISLGTRNLRKGFNDLRNELYHSLQGDIIDQELDKITERLNSVTRKDHPSQIAVNWLEYLISLSYIKPEVERIVKEYNNLVKQIHESLIS
jgi:hypothetical protein